MVVRERGSTAMKPKKRRGGGVGGARTRSLEEKITTAVSPSSGSGEAQGFATNGVEDGSGDGRHIHQGNDGNEPQHRLEQSPRSRSGGKSALQDLVESPGHMIIPSHEYHPHLAGSGIEYAWRKATLGLRCNINDTNAREDMMGIADRISTPARRRLPPRKLSQTDSFCYLRTSSRTSSRFQRRKSGTPQEKQNLRRILDNGVSCIIIHKQASKQGARVHVQFR